MTVFRAGLLDGQTALITGGGTGIGLAIARDLVSRGRDVVCLSRSGTGEFGRHVACDMTDEAAVREAFAAYQADAPEALGAVDMTAVIRHVDSRLSEIDHVVTNDAGNFSTWLHRHFRYRMPDSQAGPMAGAMGYAVPSAVGAAMARDSARVVAFVGDGGFMMTGQEISTAVQNGLKVTGDWFQSRSEHGHLFETIRPSRGRVNLVRATGAPAINSTFEFPLDEIFFRDGNGEIWRSRDVQQGRNVSLTPSDEQEFTDWFSQQKDRFGQRNKVRLDLCSTRRGHFFAVSTSADGVATLDSLNWKETHTFLTGEVPTGN